MERREPIHQPKLDHEEATDLLVHFRVELLLTLSAETIHSSHLSELKPILHVLERTLEDRVSSCQQDHQCTILASSNTNVIPKLPSCPNNDFAFSVDIDGNYMNGVFIFSNAWKEVMGYGSTVAKL